MKNQKKITRSKFFFICFLIPLMALISCSKTDDILGKSGNCANWSEQYIEQASAYSQASANYTNDPTKANCEKFKAAGLKYIDALEGALDCVPTASLEAYNASLNQYRAEISSSNCSN